jgi:hypothetical protein
MSGKNILFEKKMGGHHFSGWQFHVCAQAKKARRIVLNIIVFAVVNPDQQGASRDGQGEQEQAKQSCNRSS